MTHDASIRVPHTRLAEEVQMACDARLWSEIVAKLMAQAPNEGCAFLLTAPSRGNLRTSVLLRDPIWPELGEVRATPSSLELHADYITRAIDAAVDAGELTGIALIHTHPRSKFGEGIADFSRRDDWYDLRLFPTLLRGRPGTFGASVVLGSQPNAVDARVWWNEGDALASQPVQIIRLVGPEINFIETRASRWRDHPDPAVMDRSTRLWGAEGRRRLQNLRVGVVGAGGTGSITLLALATMGVGQIRAWDRDVIKKENLHRTLGSTRLLVGRNKVEGLADTLRNAATAKPFDFEPIEDWATTNEGFSRLRDCDLIFCCVDRLKARVPLNDFAYAHLIPVIDMASWLHPDDSGAIDAIVTHAHVWSPGIPCAWCRQTLTPFLLMREAQGNQRGIEDRIAYGLSAAETDGVEPSVLGINLLGVGLALVQFMQLAMRITTHTPRDLKFILPGWELDESDLDSVHDCRVEQRTAHGDNVRLMPV